MTIRHGGRLCFLLAVIVLLAVSCNTGDVMDPEGDRGDSTLVETQSEKTVYSIGETIVVDVVIHDAVDVGSVPFRLRYDRDVLQFLEPAVEGSFMSGDGATTVFLAADAGGGGEIIVGLGRVGLGPGISGDGTLATFRFKALQEGPCGFEFTGASVKSPQAMNLPATFSAHDVQVVP